MSNPVSTIKYNFTPNSQQLVILTHGASEGIDSDFMQKAIHKVKTPQNSVLTIQMPYKDRGESQSSGKELLDELGATQKAIDFVDYNQFTSLRFIGKSLGGIIFSNYLNQAPKEIQNKSSITVLGYIYGDAVIPAHIKNMTIIQGEYDKYGTPDQIQTEIVNSKNPSIKLVIIDKADHSYRDIDKNPTYQDEAIERLII